MHPEHRERVVFVANAYACRTGVPGYAAYRRARRARGPHASTTAAGTDGWQPIVLDVEDDFPRSVALLRRADVLLVNPIRDGLNLVASEGALVNERRRRARALPRGGRVGAPRRGGAADAPRSTWRARPRSLHVALVMPAEERAERRQPPARDRRGAHARPLARRPARRRPPVAQQSERRSASAPSGPSTWWSARASELVGHVGGAHRDLHGVHAPRRPGDPAPRTQAGRRRRRRCRRPRPTPSERSSTTVPLSTATGGWSSRDILAARTCSPVRAAASRRPARPPSSARRHPAEVEREREALVLHVDAPVARSPPAPPPTTRRRPGASAPRRPARGRSPSIRASSP